LKMVINGGGKVGSFLAMAMVKNGHLVTLIERRKEVAQKVALEVPEALIILGDGCDVRYQEDAGVDNADVFVTVTGDDDDNLVACQIAQGVFSVQRAIARVNNPKNEAIFRALGIEAVSSTTIIARLIEEEISIGNIVTLQALKKGKMALVEIELPKAGGAGAGVLAETTDYTVVLATGVITWVLDHSDATQMLADYDHRDTPAASPSGELLNSTAQSDDLGRAVVRVRFADDDTLVDTGDRLTATV
ncbi:hypothetical protein LCGC14_2815020, partial [marine sediment metagenome]